MNTCKSDAKVKKTLVRNCEQKIRSTSRIQVVREAMASSSGFIPDISPISTQKENELGQPTLCSSEIFAQYLTGVKNTAPPPITCEDLNVNRGELYSKMTKKLNFHFNERIYRNLIELNASTEDLKTRKDKRPKSSVGLIKKDLEPDIEDFCEDVKEHDSPPNIPVIKPKFRPVTTVEDGQLHRLVASFEVL